MSDGHVAPDSDQHPQYGRLFFGAAAAIGTFIAVLVAAISSTGWVIGRTTIRASG